VNSYHPRPQAHQDVEKGRIVIYDTILALDILYKGKPLVDNLWILILGPLVVVSTCIARLELWLAFDEVVCLELAHRGRVVYV